MLTIHDKEGLSIIMDGHFVSLCGGGNGCGFGTAGGEWGGAEIIQAANKTHCSHHKQKPTL